MLIAVLQGSVRSDRMGDRVAKWVISELSRRGHQPVLVDAAQLQLPVLDRMWKELKDDSSPAHAALRATLAPLAELYPRVDGFVICSAEYNHSAPPALVNLIDYFLEEYFYRPSAIVCYSVSAFGGVRAAIHLRALLAEVGMPSIPTIQPIASVATALSADGVPLNQDIAEKTSSFFEEFDWYMSAFKLGREKHDPRQA